VAKVLPDIIEIPVKFDPVIMSPITIFAERMSPD
jgi:hypothetical protein